MKNKKTGLIIGFIAVALIFFYGGMSYEKTKIPVRGQGAQAFGQNGSFGGTRGAGTRMSGSTGGTGGAITNGEIISKDATSITVKLSTGGSKIIFLSDSTKVSKSVDGTSNDLTTGTNVMISGTSNSDGSISANSVQIRPATPTPSK